MYPECSISVFTPKQRFGKWGEDHAMAFLKRQGYRIVERNVRFKVGEIDIVAIKKQQLLFVEVRSRQDGSIPPWETVHFYKLKRVIKAIRAYLHQKKLTHCTWQLAILGIWRKAEGTEIELLVQDLDCFRDMGLIW